MLRDAAQKAMLHSYSPYSKFPVGAAAITDKGIIVTGCNVENASYGLTLCAECGLVSELQMKNAGKIVGFTCVDKEHNIITPCGRCRQLLHEFAAPEMKIDTPAGILPFKSMLPQAFGPEDLL